MTIPPRYQIFDRPVTVTERDEERLTPYLTSWPRLNQLFKLDVLREPDLRMLILIELRTKKRRVILDRLVARLNMRQRETLLGKINLILADV